MTEAVVLTAEIAAKIAGGSKRRAYAKLEPVPLADGTFMLPVTVLDDPAHADVRADLATLPRAAVAKLPLYAEDEAPEPVAALARALSEFVSAKSERSISNKASAEG